jgi:ribosomal protein S18 acetylase RimI-like enzyme
LLIRKCLDGDLEACVTLFVEVFAEPPYQEEWNFRDARAYLERFWRLSPEECFVAMNNQKIEGALFGYSYPWQGGRNYYVHELFVYKTNRRRGLGRSLIEHAVENSGPGTTVSLIANEQSAAAKFYEKLGLSQHPYYKFYCGRVR